MDTKNNIKKIKQIFTLVVFSGIAIIFLSLLITAAVIIYKKSSQIPSLSPQTPMVTPPKIEKSPFTDCGELLYDCNDNQCQYYRFCQDIAGRLAGSDSKECKIYDCGDLFGFAVLTKDYKLLAQKYPKPISERQSERIVYCQSNHQIISNKCEKNTRKILLTATIPTNCFLKGFAFRKNDKWLGVDFTKTGDNTYLLTIPFCDAISDITPVIIQEK